MSTPTKTTGKKTAAKPTDGSPLSKAPTSPMSGSAPEAQTATPTIVDGPRPMVVGAAMRKKEIIEQTVTRSGLKKRDVKPLVDTLLAVMGEAMADGRELVMPPFGRLKVHKQKTTQKKNIYFAKVHQNRPSVSAPPTTESDTDI
ncbi:MAG: HU family DNA-binding protein [Sulfitobacter sp.]